VRIDNGADLCFWLAGDARKFSESRPVFPSANNLGSFHYLIYARYASACGKPAELVRLYKAGAIKNEQDASFYANLVKSFGASFRNETSKQRRKVRI
jgi:hypothetical protein